MPNNTVQDRTLLAGLSKNRQARIQWLDTTVPVGLPGQFTEINLVGFTVTFSGERLTITGSGGGGTGTVTSVALSMPAIFSVAGSPITTSGTLAVTLADETANTVFAGPASGAAAAPTFRALVAADLPGTTNTRGPGCVFTNGGLVLSGTMTSEIEVPYGFAGTGYTIVADATGSGSIVVQHSTYAAYDSMSTLFTATLSSAKKNQASVSFSLSAGDIIRFSGSSFSGATRMSIQLDGSPT